jgi:MFS family permease
MLPLVPLIGARRGSDFDAGLLTFVFMLGTVSTQVWCPWLMRRVSKRLLLASGLLLLGIPSLAYASSRLIGWMVAVSVVRGVGFGLMTVASTTLVAATASAERRGRSIGIYGILASGVGVFCPALGLWMDHSLGASSVFMLAAVAGAAAAGALGGSWEKDSPAPPQGVGSLSPVLRLQAGPGALAFLGGVILAAVYSFLALRVSRGAGVAILVFGSLFALSRLQVGRLADRKWNAEALLIVSAVLGTVGMGGLAATSNLLVGCLCSAAIGAGAGGILSLSLLVMVNRAGDDELVRATTLWNVSYDGGNALGGLALGALIGPLSLAGPYAMTGALLAVAALAMALSQRERLTGGRWSKRQPHLERGAGAGP